MAARIYLVTVHLVVPEHADAHLETPQGIKDEIQSWLTDLKADVRSITVVEEEEEWR
jgi:predicted Co/Zn/Cd cation transporter (cation efflux family)